MKAQSDGSWAGRASGMMGGGLVRGLLQWRAATLGVLVAATLLLVFVTRALPAHRPASWSTTS